jgi:1-acyl-sn-glycerol-3-phosphate acyltransferase
LPVITPLEPSPPPRDPFGYNAQVHDQVRPVAEFFYRKYWRVQTVGLEHIPDDGPALIVGNHSGAIPLDAAMLMAAVDLEHPRKRLLRFLYDPFVARMPVMGDFYNRVGAVVASYENARTLLRRGELVGIFPEGVQGVAKGVSRRYRLEHFRTGFLRLSVELSVPIVPVAVVGAEETYPVIGKWTNETIGKLLNVPYVPITPFFPLLGMAGIVPLPTRWRVQFGAPLHPYREIGPAPSRRKIAAATEACRRHIQGMVHQLLASRASFF